MAEEKEAFLDRWSRRKQDQAKEVAAPMKEAGDAPAPLAPSAPPVLPAVEDLKPDSDFRPFMDPRIDKGTRREALKKLFADASFNVPDPFEPYSRDFNEDPIPPEMLKQLDQARRLIFDEKKEPLKEEAKEQVAEQATAEPSRETQVPESKDVAGKQDA